MPYIEAQARPQMDALMDPLIDHMKGLPMQEQDGILNYVLTRMLKSVYPSRYFHFNRALGMLSAVTQEYYRVVVGPYEDTKIHQNGQVAPRQ